MFSNLKINVVSIKKLNVCMLNSFSVNTPVRDHFQLVPKVSLIVGGLTVFTGGIDL